MNPRKPVFLRDTCCLCLAATRGIYVRFDPSRCQLEPKKFKGEWTHALCDACYSKERPGQVPVRARVT